jgi:hypothetical protein
MEDFISFIGIVLYSSHVISESLYYGMAHPQVSDGGMASNMEGSCKCIE